jgi:hypothetical protein
VDIGFSRAIEGQGEGNVSFVCVAGERSSSHKNRRSRMGGITAIRVLNERRSLTGIF